MAKERNASEYLEIIGLLHPDVCVHAGGANYADLIWRSPLIDQATLDAEIDNFTRLREEVSDITPEMISAGVSMLSCPNSDYSILTAEDIVDDIFRVMMAVKAKAIEEDI